MRKYNFNSKQQFPDSFPLIRSYVSCCYALVQSWTLSNEITKISNRFHSPFVLPASPQLPLESLICIPPPIRPAERKEERRRTNRHQPLSQHTKILSITFLTIR